MPRLPLCTHQFTLTGLNLERFLNLLSRQGVPVLSARRTGPRTLECRCYSADAASIRLLAEEKGWRVDDLRPAGLSAALHRLRRRPGLLIGGVLTLVLLLVLSQFVWQVEVHQAGAYQADIAAYLAQEGYGPGRLRSTVDAAALEAALTRRYPRVAWFHVYVRFVTLVVDVTQGVPMPELSPSQPGDVVAQRDGIIQRIAVFAGTARVQAGDAVQAGQVLIAGQERGADGELVPVAARGEVLARCWQSQRVSLPLYEILSGETGRQTVQTRLCTPLFAYPAEIEGAPYLAWNTYVEKQPVGGCFFPLWLETITQKEIWQQYALRDEETVGREARQAALEKLAEALAAYEIIDKWVDYCMIEGDTITASATAEWVMEIGGPEPP